MVLRETLLALRQTGTVAAYHEQFKKLLATPVPSPVTGADAIFYFRRGLQEHIRLALLAADDTDLDAVVQRAKDYEMAYSFNSMSSAAAAAALGSTTSANRKNLRRRRRRNLLASR